MIRLFCGVAVLCCCSALFGQTPGIFADFTTSMGSFSCRLDYTNAPKAVASFIGLATGQRAWIDFASKAPRAKPFYNGLTFHRVIDGFMIQGGCPNGTGTNGPGYSFIDECVPVLRFDRAGVLAMANAQPDANGSQFFVTVAATPWLNDLHTIFGHVVSGQEVVNAISKVSTSMKDAPLTPVIIQSVQIRRQGAAAQAFDINGQGLPYLDFVPLTISNLASELRLSFTNRHNADPTLLRSTNLVDWQGEPLGMLVQHSGSNWLEDLQRAPTNRMEYFKIAQMFYPETRPVPLTMEGQVVIFEFDQRFGTNYTQFGPGGMGLFEWPVFGGAGNVYQMLYSWQPDVYCGRLLPAYWYPMDPFVLHLRFQSPTNGTFTGKYSADNSTCTGVFRVLEIVN